METESLSVKRTVLIYRRDLLPFSETFIREQVLVLHRWSGVLIGHRQLKQLSLNGVNVLMLGSGRRLFATRLLRKAGLLPWLMDSALQGMRPSILDRLHRLNPSLLHAHFGVDAVSAWPLAEKLGLPMLVTLHGYDINVHRHLWELGHRGGAFRKYPSRLLVLGEKSQVRFIAVSGAIRQQAIAFGLPANKISVLYTGIDTDVFRPGGLPLNHRRRRVLFVGRLVEKKGCRYLLSAMPIVRKRLPEAEVVLVGDGPLRSDLQKQAAALGIRAEFRGVLQPEDVRREMDQAAVLCLPSVTSVDGDAEGFGMVLLEAQAMGVPVITSARGGSTEGILEGETGLAFAEGDIMSLAKELEEILSDAALAHHMAMNGPRFVAEHFNIHQQARKLEEFYDEIVKDRETRCVSSASGVSGVR